MTPVLVTTPRSRVHHLMLVPHRTACGLEPRDTWPRRMRLTGPACQRCRHYAPKGNAA